jgi:hypothetical protein
MQRYAVVLFALVALFGIVVPSSASTLSHLKRETNADRFARGLPPLPPTRRATAKRQQNSQPSVPTTGRIQVRDLNGYSHGYVQNGPSGPNGINLGDNPDYSDLNVIFNPVEQSIFCLDSDFDGVGGSYFGVPTTTQILSADSPDYVLLTNVAMGNVADEADIWSINPAGQLGAVWVNIDASTVVVSFAYKAATNTLAIVVGIASFIDENPGWNQVNLFIV